MNRDSAISLIVFFVLLIACTAVGYWLIFRLGRATPIMLAVGAATILTCLIRKRSLATLGWSDTRIIVLHFLLTATYSFVLLLPGVLGEEMGWRGFLVPELTRFMSFTGVSLTSGLIWSMWHWPLIFMGLYGNDITPLYYQLFFFTLFIVSYAFIMTYLRLKTGSLWTAVIFHMSGNVFIQNMFGPLTIENESSSWYVGEFGAVPALVAFAFAFLFWKKGKTEFG